MADTLQAHAPFKPWHEPPALIDVWVHVYIQYVMDASQKSFIQSVAHVVWNWDALCHVVSVAGAGKS